MDASPAPGEDEEGVPGAPATGLPAARWKNDVKPPARPPKNDGRAGGDRSRAAPPPDAGLTFFWRRWSRVAVTVSQ